MAYSYVCRLWKVILYVISFKTDVAPTASVLPKKQLIHFSNRTQKVYTEEGKERGVDISQLSNS